MNASNLFLYMCGNMVVLIGQVEAAECLLPAIVCKLVCHSRLWCLIVYVESLWRTCWTWESSWSCC